MFLKIINPYDNALEPIISFEQLDSIRSNIYANPNYAAYCFDFRLLGIFISYSLIGVVKMSLF